MTLLNKLKRNFYEVKTYVENMDTITRVVLSILAILLFTALITISLWLPPLLLLTIVFWVLFPDRKPVDQDDQNAQVLQYVGDAAFHAIYANKNEFHMITVPKSLQYFLNNNIIFDCWEQGFLITLHKNGINNLLDDQELLFHRLAIRLEELTSGTYPLTVTKVNSDDIYYYAHIVFGSGIQLSERSEPNYCSDNAMDCDFQ